MDVLIVDLALLTVAVGLLSTVRPLRFLGLRSRLVSAIVALAGCALLLIGLLLPTPSIRLPGPAMALDTFVPEYPFGEHHEIVIAAPPGQVYAAVRAVTAREIHLFRLLTWLRAPRWPGRGDESILSPDPDRPILEVALGSGFVILHDEPGREIVVGTIVCCGQPKVRSASDFHAARGSVARAAMGFHLSPVPEGTRLVTQTRIHATDDRARRRFATYWRVIYPGSALIRVMWLRAIRDRALAES